MVYCPERAKGFWGYVTHLTENSISRWPLIADSTAPGTTQYSRRQDAPGGTWRGSKAIVIYVDGSGGIEKVNLKTMTIPGPTSEIPDILQSGRPNWLAPDNQFMNPIPPSSR